MTNLKSISNMDWSKLRDIKKKKIYNKWYDKKEKIKKEW